MSASKMRASDAGSGRTPAEDSDPINGSAATAPPPPTMASVFPGYKDSQESDTPRPPKSVNRLSVPLNKDGKVDWDSMRGTTKEKVADMLRTNSAPGDSPVTLFGSPEIRTLYVILGQIESLAASKITGLDIKETQPVMSYTDQEIKLLETPTIAVVNKYGGPALAKYKDEIALAGILVAVHMQKVRSLQQIVVERKGKNEHSQNGTEQVRQTAENAVRAGSEPTSV